MKLFHEQILKTADNFPHEPALTDAENGQTINFGTFSKWSVKLSDLLLNDYLLQKGQIVMCLMNNSIYYPIIFTAAARIGCPLTGTKCRAIFTTADLLENIAQKAEALEIPVFVIGKVAGQFGIDLEAIFESPDHLIQDVIIAPHVEISEDDVLMAPLSSGTTTGTPKCVLLTHKNFNTATQALKEHAFEELTDRQGRRTTMALLPFYHASGFWALCYCLLEGHHSLIMRKFQATQFLESIQNYKIDTVNLVPSLVTFLLRNPDLVDSFDLSSMKTILCGSGAVSESHILEFRHKFPNVVNFLRGYGMTELVVLSHMTPLDEDTCDEVEKHLNSCGKLLPGFEAKIVNLEDTTGKPLDSGIEGELWLRSDAVMKGYLDDSEETAKTLDSEGDVFYFDDLGYYYLVDRIKNLIKVNGLQVSSENILLTHEDVLEAAVVGIPDESRGEVPKAFVVLSEKVMDLDQDAKLAEIYDFVNSQLTAPYKHLRGGIASVPSLPKTASGKILKSNLKNKQQTGHEFCDSLL